MAAEHGAKVAIAEADRWGGTCVIRGCVPKKLLVYAAEVSRAIDDARGYANLLVHLARRCVREGLARFEWAVLDWNAPAIGFYENLGARMMTEWRTFRLTGESLSSLAEQAR